MTGAFETKIFKTKDNSKHCSKDAEMDDVYCIVADWRGEYVE